MAFLDHLHHCNRHDLAGFRRFLVGGAAVGWIRHRLAVRLAGFDQVFEVTPEQVALRDSLSGFAERTEALAGVIGRLVAEGTIPPLRHELYPVVTTWGAEPLLAIDRVAVMHFGIAAFGIHVNGFVREPSGNLLMWIGRRARDRAIAPGKLDNLIAGGQPIGLSLRDNLAKEAWEEAGVDADLAARARPVGALTYRMEQPVGFKPDTLFLYDLELTAGFQPRNTDGEVDSFELWPLDRVAAVVRETDDFKFNVNLVMIDFLIRHGWLTPDQPDYLELVRGLHR